MSCSPRSALSTAGSSRDLTVRIDLVFQSFPGARVGFERIQILVAALDGHVLALVFVDPGLAFSDWLYPSNEPTIAR